MATGAPTPPPVPRSAKRKAYPCPNCDTTLTSRNGTRHKRVCIKTIKTPITAVQRSRSIGEVLDACRIPIGSLECWGMEELEKLPNMRLQPLSNDKGRFTPWRVAEDESELPTLSDILVDVGMKLAFGEQTDVASQDVIYELWNGTQHIESGFDKSAWTSYHKDLASGREVATRVLNVAFPGLHETSLRAGFAASCTRVVEDMYGGEMEILTPNSNITPRLTKTEVHFDSCPSTSTSVGLTRDPSRPMKLWIIWPSTEIQGLECCLADTKKALRVLEHGRFLVQMPGEIVGVPASSPHAVFTLNSCHLIGHSFVSETSGLDPASICVDVRSGTPVNEAVERRLLQLEIGLRDKRLAPEHARHFLRSWLSDAEFYTTPSLKDRLVRVWSDNVTKRGQCFMCEMQGVAYEQAEDVESHITGHIFDTAVRASAASGRRRQGDSQSPEPAESISSDSTSSDLTSSGSTSSDPTSSESTSSDSMFSDTGSTDDDSDSASS